MKLILSFIIGGAWITLATVVAEKCGTKLGGVIAGLPSTALITFFFIGWTQSTNAAAEATTLSPLIGAVIYLSMLVYLSLVRKINFWLALIASLFVWFVLSLGVYSTSFRSFWISMIVLVLVLTASYYVLEKVLKIKSESKRKLKHTLPLLLFRGSMTGIIIAIAVLLAKVSGPVLGGVFAMFPAAFLGTIIVTHLAHGKDFSSGVMKIAILTGVSVIAFVVFVRFRFVPLGLIWGTIVSLLGSWLIGYGVHLFAKKKLK